jgi:hypothetical protein
VADFEDYEGLEKRADGRDRDRIAVIAKRFADQARALQIGQEQLEAGRRRNRTAIRALEVALAVAMVAFAWSLWLQHRQSDRIAAQSNTTARVAREQTVARYRAVYTACLERNKTNDGIVAYLRYVGVHGAGLRRANRYFPDQPDCKTYTLALLGPDAPPGAFDVPELIRTRSR